MEFGYLVVFRNGKPSAPYELEEGEHTIGSSMDSNIRLKFSHPLLLETHSLIRVNKSGVATMINKSIGAPARVNGKVALKPIILRHEDKFEILEKVFQYFNEHLKNEPEDSEIFLNEKKNILAKSRRSVNPVIKTPAKKSLNLKTKTPSIRKSASAIPRPAKGLQVIITPNKKPDNRLGSKTTSKIIVSKALVSPHSSKKRRLSLDNSHKASKSPKISSRNILLSKSTINITISEEHEYSEITPSRSMKTIQENELSQEGSEETKDRTLRKSVKVESGDTPKKNISIALIDFNSPNTPAKQFPEGGRSSTIRKASELVLNESPSVMKTPVNKRIQSLITLRHSLKKDTPPPRLNLPRVTVQPPTPQKGQDIFVTYSPNVEPNTHSFTQKESRTPRTSTIKKFEGNGTPVHNSRMSFTIEAPTEASPVNLEFLTKSDHLTDNDSEIVKSENVAEIRRPSKSRSSKGVVNEELSDAERLTKSKQNLPTEEPRAVLEMSKSRRSSRYSLKSPQYDPSEQSPKKSQQKVFRRSQSKKWSHVGAILSVDSPDDVDEQTQQRKSLRIISASTEDSDADKQSSFRKSGRNSSNLRKSKGENIEEHKRSFLNPQNKSSISRHTSRASTKDQDASSNDEMDDLQITEADKSNDYSSTDNDEHISEVSRHSRSSRNVSIRSNKLDRSDNIPEQVSSESFNKYIKLSRNASRNTSKLESSQTGHTTDTEENIVCSTSVTKPSRMSSNLSRQNTKIDSFTDSSQSEDDTRDIDEQVKKSSRVSRNSSKASTNFQTSDDVEQNRQRKSITVISASTEDSDANKHSSFRKSGRKSSNLRKSTIDNIKEHKGSFLNPQNKSSISSLTSSTNTKDQDASSNDEMDDLQITEADKSNDYSSTDNDEHISEVSRHSRSSRNVSIRSNKLDRSDNIPEQVSSESFNKYIKLSRNASRNTSKLESSQTGHTTDTEENIVCSTSVTKSSRMSSNLSRQNTKIDSFTDSSQSEDDTRDIDEHVKKSSRVSRNSSKASTNFQTSDDVEQNRQRKSIRVISASTEDSDANKHSSFRKSGRKSSNLRKSTIDNIKEHKGSLLNPQNKSSISRLTSSTNTKDQDASSNDEMDDLQITEADKSNDYSSTDNDEHISDVSRYSRSSRNVSMRSNKLDRSDNRKVSAVNFNKHIKLSRNASRNTSKLESSQTEDNTTDAEENIACSTRINKYSRMSNNLSRENTKMDSFADTSQSEDDTRDTDEQVNKSSRVSRNSSKTSTNFQTSDSFSQTGDDTSDTDNASRSSRISRITSRISRKIKVLNSSSQTDDNTTDVDNNANTSSSGSRRFSKRTSKVEILDNSSLSQSENKGTDVDNSISKSSRVSRNASRPNTNIEEIADCSKTEDNNIYVDVNINKSSRKSRNASKRSSKMEATTSSSPTENDASGAENNVNKSARMSLNSSRRDRSTEDVSAYSSPIKDNTDKEGSNNNFFGFRISSRKSKNVQKSSNSLSNEHNSSDAMGSFSNRSSLSKNISHKRRNDSAIAQHVSGQTPNNTSRNKSRSIRAVDSESSIDSEEATFNVQQDSGNKSHVSGKGPKNRSRQGLNLFDESTQEAKNTVSASKNKSQRISIFDESTKEFHAEFEKSKSMIPNIALDDTQEVLSPVRPLSSRTPVRSSWNQELGRSVGHSTRVSTRGRKSLNNSSLTSTSLDQSSGSVISVPSDSFSSFKRDSLRTEYSHDGTEIDVVNISSTIDDTEVNKIVLTSSSNIKSKILEESTRTSLRRSKTSEMFKDVSCTSTPFYKQNLNKKSQESDTSKNESTTQNKSSSALTNSNRLGTISISSASDSVFLDSSAERRSRSSSIVHNETRASSRRSSRRNSIAMHRGENDCVSCRNSSIRRSRSQSLTGQPVVAAKRNNSSSRLSKMSRSSAVVFDQTCEETSPAKTNVSPATDKMTTPLLQRKSVASSLSEKTPEKIAETEDETPKSSIKPTRRSSKTNQSAYNPLIEDITPVTPEKLMVSGFTEDVFKTPINTPGLFENIRKSVIRSRKRHRESTGSSMKNSKRARVDFAEDERLETSIEVQHPERKPQKSPVNRLSNFEGVKKLMKIPQRSPKNDLRNVPNLRHLVSPKHQSSPKNDLTSIAGLKKIFNTPKDVKSPKNDLTNIPNLRRLVSPKRQITPKNDLRQVPNLRRIMSSKEQHSPKNDLSSPVGVKQLFKTPRVQKEPTNDLGNVTGVASLFNVSGVEVLHQGSDIENSEDLFTKLTGKTPVRSYPRGKSLSPSKEMQQAQSHSRKTMGDLPVCSPRVQQWVQDHTNIMYTAIEDPTEVTVSGDEDILFKVSRKLKNISRKGHSVSPKKTVKGAKSRRKTSGDTLVDIPDVTAWKAEQAVQVKTRRSSTVRKTSVKIESPERAEKATPQQNKVKADLLTPQQQQPVTPANETASPASVRTRRGAPKIVVADHEELERALKEAATSLTVKIVASEGFENKPVSARKRGGRQKRILSVEELDVVTLNTPSLVQEPLTKKTRGRRGAAKIATSPIVIQEEREAPEILTRKGKADSQDEKDIDSETSPEVVTRGRPRRKQDDQEVSASPVRKGGRRGKRAEKDVLVEKEQVDKATPISSVPEKSSSRSRRGRKIDDSEKNGPVEEKPIQNETTQKRPGLRGRSAKKDVELETENVREVSAIKTSTGKRRQKVDEVTSQTEGAAQCQEDTKSLVSGRRGKKLSEDVAEEFIEGVKKLAAKGRRGKKEEEQGSQTDPAVDQNKEPEAKKPPRGRKGKKVIEEEATKSPNKNLDQLTDDNNQNKEPEVKKLPRGRKGKKIIEEAASESPNKNLAKQTEESDVNKHLRTTRGRKIVENINGEQEGEITEVSNAKTKASSRKGAVQEIDTDVEFRKPTRGKSKRDGPQGSNEEDVTDNTVLAKRGARKDRKKNDWQKTDEIDDNGVAGAKQRPRAKGKKEQRTDKSTKRGGINQKAEDIREVIESPKKPASRGRGKKVIEETTEDLASSQPPQKQTTRKLRNKVIEDVIDMDVDSPRTARAKRGINKKYSTDEYEVTEEKGGLKRKVRFEDDPGANKQTPEIGTRKSKRTRK